MPRLKNGKQKITAIVLLCVFLALLLLPTAQSAEPLKFEHSGNTLAGKLRLPDGDGPFPAVILVHGDGALPWDAYGYYEPFISALNDVGYAVFSWDKPGVGQSTGNWLSQSMQDRADEVKAAKDALTNDTRIQSQHVGLLGFSQAGWVMPKSIADHPEFAFMISISGAINWVEQAEYMTRNRLEMEGASPADIQQAIRYDQTLIALMYQDVDYETYQAFALDAPPCCEGTMSEDRWTFVRRNFRSDARSDLEKVTVPVLALFGKHDLNVDAAQSAAVYRDILANTGSKADIQVLPNADHSLFPADSGRLVKPGFALTKRLLLVDIIGADAFADDAVGQVARWVQGMSQP